MIRTRCAAMIGSLVASLIFACAATATPATPAISVQQPSALTVQLTSSTGTRWSWTIVDAANAVVATSTDNPMTVTLPAAGDYRALLDATDDDPVLSAPAHAETTFHVDAQPVVVNRPPVAELDVLSSPTAMGSPVLLDASRSTDPDQDALTYSWDLDGDGRYGDATGALQTVSYPRPGRYRVGVQVSDGHGATSTAQGVITVLVDQAPSVSFANDPVQPAVGATVTFTATATDADGTVDDVDWDLDDDGDFDDAAGPWASWSFDVAGRHRIAVRATDDRGVATVAFRSIVVTSPIFPTTSRTEPLPPTGPSANGSAPATAIPNVPAPGSARIPLLAPFPVVRISGTLSRGSVRISLLKVQAPPGATIRVRCHGGSCASERPDVRVQAARKPLRVRSFERRPLRAGTVIEVLVTAPGQIGKYTRFTVRRGAAPSRSDLCLRPGHTTPTGCPAT